MTVLPEPDVEGFEEIPSSRLMRRLRADRGMHMWAGLLALLVISCLFGPFLSPHDPNTGDLLRTLETPSGEHWLGTDQLGRDILTRVLHGGQVALGAAAEAVAVAFAIGLPLGLWFGYRGGWADRIGMRIVEGIVSLPFLIVAIAFMSIVGPGLVKSMAIVGVIYAMYVLRLVRGLMLAEREAGYVDAARVAGLGDRQIVLSEALPNIASPLIVQGTQLFASGIIIEATLSFLGFGVKSPTASWGSMLSIAQEVIRQDWWQSIPPGVAIFVTALAFNQVGDGIRDLFARETTGGNLGITTERSSAADDSAPPAGGNPERAEHPPLLSTRGVRVEFPSPRGGLVAVVDDVAITVGRGEIVALVGESGSGKSITAMALAGLVPSPGRVAADEISLDGNRMERLTFEQHRRIRGKDLGIVFQEPIACLNPAFTVGDQVAEVVRQHLGKGRRAARAEVISLFDRVGIPNAAARYGAYPHEFSGGMAQRVMIAMALAGRPKLLIADEPTTALDVTIQGQILDLLLDIRDTEHLSILLITHDLGVVADVADRVVVMYAGEVVEQAEVFELFSAPRHPYTQGLLEAVPRNRPRTGELPSIRGTIAPPWEWPEGCHFAARCPHVLPACTEAPVPLLDIGGRRSRCIRVDELAQDGGVLA